jgi:hypothetical protein
LFARVIAVADAYDAITSTRPYRVSAGREHACAVLRAEAGAQFDPMIVTSFIDALPVRLPVAGALVLLGPAAALGRKLAVWLKRVGAGHLAPAVATLGAVVTLGAFMPSPSIAPPPPVVAQEVAADEAAAAPSTAIDPEERPAREHKKKVKVEAAPTDDVVLGTVTVRSDPARDVEAPPEPKPPAVVEAPEQPECAKGPDGQGEESSQKGRDTATDRSDGRGPNHC